jgi:hypothetical protein
MGSWAPVVLLDWLVGLRKLFCISCEYVSPVFVDGQPAESGPSDGVSKMILYSMSAIDLQQIQEQFGGHPSSAKSKTF